MSLRVLRSMLLGLLSLPVLASAQTNDECSGATVIKRVPSTRSLAVDFATAGASDPTSSCTGIDANVWYTYTARSDVSLELDTTGSSYAARIGVFTGECATLTEVGCGEDHLIVSLHKGETIRIAVTTDGGTSDETLTLAARKSSPRYREPARVADVVRSSDASPYGGSQGQLLAAVAPNEKTTVFAQDTEAIVVDVGGVLTTIAASGDPTPAGGTFVTLRPPVVSATAVYFSAIIEGGPVTSGIFKWNGTTLQSYLLPGASAPGGTTLRSIGNRLAVSENDVLAVVGRTTADSHDRVLRYDGTTLTVLATEGDATPCGHELRTLAAELAIDQSGTTVVFNATVNGVGDAILTANGTALAAIACEDAPTPVGGTFQSFGTRPTINDLGEVYFTASVKDGPAEGETVWVSSGGAATLVAARNLVLATGQTIRRIQPNQQLATNAAGDLVFTATFLSGRGLIRRPHLAPLPSAIVLSSDACPVGGTFRVFDDDFDVSAAGDVVFDADCTGGHGAFRKALAAGPVTVASTATATAIGPGVNVGRLAIDAAGTRVAGSGFRLTLQSRTCARGGCDPPIGLVDPRTPIANVAGQIVGSIFDGTLASSPKTIAFAAATAGNVAATAILRLEKGAVEAIASQGDPLPGGVGSFLDLAIPDSFGSSSTATIGVGTGVVAFHAVLEHPTAGEGIFAATDKGLVTVALSGDPAPRGETFDRLGLPTVRGKSIVFGADTDTLGPCIFGTPAAGKPLEAIACSGDPLPPPLDGTIDGFRESPSGSVHDLYVVAELFPASGECLLHVVKGTMTPVRCLDDLYPGGGRYDAFSNFGIAPQADGKGKSVMFLTDAYPDNLVLLSAREDTITRLLVPGVTPAPSGGTFDDLLFAAPSSTGGSVIATTTVNDAPARYGIFRFELP